MRPDTVSAPVILRVQDGAAAVVSDDFVAGYLREYVSYMTGPLSAYNVAYRTCKAIVESWRFQAKDLDELPKPVGFASDPELCMTKLPFDPKLVTQDELRLKAPIFAGMLERLSNAEAFCMRLGSLFDPKADRKQAVWMSGPPDCGKSQFSWLLGLLVGGAYGILSNTDLEDKYWKAQLVGKRLGLVHEAAARFIRSGEFKSITGDDEHSVNQKHQRVVNVKLPVMMFFFSNQPPEIPRDDALIERIIDCRIGPVPREEMMTTAEIREKLTVELPYITGFCLSRYLEIPGGGRIPCTGETLTETIESFESEYIDLLEHNLIKDDAAYLLRSRFEEIMRESHVVTPQSKGIFKRVLLTHFGAKERRMTFRTNREGRAKRPFVYEGVRERFPDEKQFIEDTVSPRQPNSVTQGQTARIIALSPMSPITSPSLERREEKRKEKETDARARVTTSHDGGADG